MNREILFNGFHEDRNGNATIYIENKVINGEWVYGAYCKLDDKQNETAHIISYAEDDTFGDWIEVVPSTVGEYTGITDKKGKRIFEHCVICVPLTGYTFIVSFGKCGGVGNTYHFGYEGFYLEAADDKTRGSARCEQLRNDLHYWVGEYEVEVVGTSFG